MQIQLTISTFRDGELRNDLCMPMLPTIAVEVPLKGTVPLAFIIILLSGGAAGCQLLWGSLHMCQQTEHLLNTCGCSHTVLKGTGHG